MIGGPPATPAPAELFSNEAEQQLLGAILMNADALPIAEVIVQPEDFAFPVHAELFARFQEARDNGRGINVALVQATLGPFGKEDLGGLDVSRYVARLAASATTVINTPDFANIIRDYSDKRSMLMIADGMRTMAESRSPPERVAAAAIDELDAIAARRIAPSARPVMFGAAASASMDRMQAAMQSPGRLTGLRTGLSSLDEKLGGLKRGELIVLAGRPGMGKSAIAVTICRLMAEAGFNLHLFSLEMNAESIGDRALADIVWREFDPIPYVDISKGKVSNAQAERLLEAAERFRALPLKIDPQGGLSVSQIAARARKHKQTLERAGKTLDGVIVDHLHIVSASERYRGNKVHEVTEISGALKALAKELNVPLLALAQLNRSVETRENMRPMLSDLRESGALEQDADAILLLFREAYYLANSKGKDAGEDAQRMFRLAEVQSVLEVNVAKQRNGPVGVVEIYCNIACNVFRDAAGDRYAERGAA